MKNSFILFIILALVCGRVAAQRFTDKLDRGLVAVKTSSGVFLSWRIQADEYYDVKYNVYYNGAKLNDTPLEVSNFTHSGADGNGTYIVKAVVKGVEKEENKSVSVFNSNYKEITPRHDNSLKATYEPNDACCADVDGDGELEILMKYTNVQESSNYWPTHGYLGEYSLFECLKQDGTVLWWVNCGPNMGDFQNNEQNIIGYDWDKDGKAEVVMRLAEGSVIHKADGLTYTIGANGQNGGSWTNYRTNGADLSAKGVTTPFVVYFGTQRPNSVTCNQTWCRWEIQGNNVVVTSVEQNGWEPLTPNTSGRTATFTIDGKQASIYQAGVSRGGNDGAMTWFTHYGKEFLVYANGMTGDPYQCIDFPLKRLESGETDLSAAWGDGYGHRSSKYFFGAPCLDGKNASLFLARGIYTRHKMIAYDIDSNHKLKERWKWTNNQKTNPSPWYGQGYHNFCIADVDMDGRDEIVFGSMVIDDNGKGLSTTGLGHGDALHVSDFNPYVHGLEGFFCNEDEPGNNLRDMTTSHIYYRQESTNDDGRAIMGNFSNAYPGAQGSSSRDGSFAISAVANDHLPIGTTGMAQNFRIYWDGDLCEETFNGTSGANSAGGIYKYGRVSAEVLEGSLVNNDTKATPCYQGDLFGDWREEVMMRTADNKIRIYTTTAPTEYRNYSLWYDHQYRNAMVWQMCGYNQPPHTSYFLGEMEGITVAPPPLTTQGREIIADGGNISTSYNNKHVLVSETGNASVSVASGAQPDIVTFNVPTWVQGSAQSECTTKETTITTTVYTLNVTGSAFSGNTRLVKQGDGVLVLPNVEQTYSGPTDIWEGTVDFHNSLTNSDVWMNRHTVLSAGNAAGNAVFKSLTMEYGSTLYPSAVQDGKSVSIARLSVGNLTIKEGACVEFDFNANTEYCDQLNVSNLEIVTKDWSYGPMYDAPVFRFKNANGLANGKYKIGTVTGTVQGKASNILIEGVTTAVGGSPVSSHVYDGVLYLVVGEAEEEPETDTTVEETVTWKLDFEEASTNNYGFVLGSCTAEQRAVADNNHVFHVDQGGGSGDRTANISFTDAAFKSDCNYKFEFDWGFAVSNANSSKTELLIDGGNKLFYIETPAYGLSKLYDASGIQLCEVPNNGYDKKCPTTMSHFVITSSSAGTFLTVTSGYGDLVKNVKINDSFVHITALNTTLGRAVSHMALDDITLTQYKVKLSDAVKPVYDAGTYALVELVRTLKAGYNTLCLPFDAKVTDIAGTGAKAYTLTNGSLDGNNLSFPEVTDGQLLANKPYVIMCTSDIVVPDQGVTTLYSPVPESVTGGGWTMVGNYTPHFSTEGKYIIYNNELRKCGATAWVDGMRAYFVAPAGAANARVRVVFGEDTESSIDEVLNADGESAIYGLDGKKRSALQRGINIIRMKDGSLRKEYVK